MKTSNSRITKSLLLMAVLAVMSWSATGISRADDYYHHHHDAWSHDGHGYWDARGDYHGFDSYHNHHGYWRTRDDGVRFFINID